MTIEEFLCYEKKTWNPSTMLTCPEDTDWHPLGRSKTPVVLAISSLREDSIISWGEWSLVRDRSLGRENRIRRCSSCEWFRTRRHSPQLSCERCGRKMGPPSLGHATYFHGTLYTWWGWGGERGVLSRVIWHGVHFQHGRPHLNDFRFNYHGWVKLEKRLRSGCLTTIKTFCD